MKLKTLSAAVLLAASTFAVNAWADGSWRYNFSSNDNSISSAETFHCRLIGASADTTKVTFKNGAEKITGFKEDGSLTLPSGNNTINNVYFKAYHDPDDRYKGKTGYVDVTTESGKVYCRSGEGLNRHLMPGDYH